MQQKMPNVQKYGNKAKYIYTKVRYKYTEINFSSQN